MPAVEMTQAEYARHRGVSRQMIGKLIGNGKIPASAITPAKKIDVVAADLALGETIERVVARETETAAPAGDDTAAAGTGLNKAKTALAVYQANLARQQYRLREKELVERADVEASMHRACEILGRDIDQFAARADDIATAFSRGGIEGLRVLLKQISREVRATLSNNMRLLEQSESEPDESDVEDQAT